MTKSETTIICCKTFPSFSVTYNLYNSTEKQTNMMSKIKKNLQMQTIKLKLCRIILQVTFDYTPAIN